MWFDSCESCLRWKHDRLCSLSCSAVEVVGRKHQIGWSGDFSLAWLVTWIIDCLSTLAARSFFTTVFLGVRLVNFFLLVSRGVFLITPSIILSMLFTNAWYKTDICFRVFSYGKVKRTVASQLSRTSAKVLLQQVNRSRALLNSGRGLPPWNLNSQVHTLKRL